MINSGHAFLVEGYDNNHSHKLGENLVKQFLCEGCNDSKCNECALIERLENPNVIYINGFENGIKADDIVMVKDYCSTLNVTGKQFIIFIDGIEKANKKAANSFLKFLEEPRNDIKFVLTTNNKEMVLPTIYSRCQFINEKSNFSLEKPNQTIELIIANRPFEIDWSTIDKSGLNEMLNKITRTVPTKGNEEFLQTVLTLINKNNSNVNKNLLITELINAIKNRRI